VIGYSVEGRPLTVYRFGQGKQHGIEKVDDRIAIRYIPDTKTFNGTLGNAPVQQILFGSGIVLQVLDIPGLNGFKYPLGIRIVR
jgi:hypothetical protein